MALFEFSDYKLYVRTRFKKMPKQGWGEFQKLAKALVMHTTTVSQIFKGDKHLTLEQAAGVIGYLGLSELEGEYFLALVEKERAGNHVLKNIMEKRLQNIRTRAQDLVHRVQKDRVLSEPLRAQFYSNWYYSAIRMTCDIPGYQSAEAIAEKLRLPLALVHQTISFLLRSGLLVERNGELELGTQRTYLEASSPLISRHHSNWRSKAADLHLTMDPGLDLAFSGPTTFSKADGARIREMLADVIEKIMKINVDSKAEEVRILNIDWLRL